MSDKKPTILPWHLFGQIFGCPDGTTLIIKTEEFNIRATGAGGQTLAKTKLPKTSSDYQATATGEWSWVDDRLRRKFTTEQSTEVWLEDDLLPGFSRSDLEEWRQRRSTEGKP